MVNASESGWRSDPAADPRREANAFARLAVAMSQHPASFGLPSSRQSDHVADGNGSQR